MALITLVRPGSDAALRRFAGVNQRLKFNNLGSAELIQTPIFIPAECGI